jgi:hypothetical protein
MWDWSIDPDGTPGTVILDSFQNGANANPTRLFLLDSGLINGVPYLFIGSKFHDLYIYNLDTQT